MEESIKVTYAIESLREYGFVGFVPLKDWDEFQVIGLTQSDIEGVYVVVRESTDVPKFRDEDHRKPRPKRWSAEDAADRWVSGVQVLYFGKGPLRSSKAKRRQGLARRVRELQKHGYRGGANHYGGKLLWQIDDIDSLLIAWKPLAEGESAAIESGLIRGFERVMGRQPYANIGAPLINSTPIYI
ncbi:MAG: hypothetical protein JWQ12_1764 [Glaciihabitans sp.]|nr:hypothetical protein [Glaciihabitans sp.]